MSNNLKTEFMRTSLLGKTLEQAQETIKDTEWVLRVTKRDGVAGIATRDYKLNRFNLELKDGIVVDVHIG